MKTVLVPTDFSPAASNAAEYAVNFAKATGAEVLLLHVYNVPVPLSIDAPTMPITPDDLQKENEMFLIKEVERLKKKTNIDAKHMIKTGFAVDAILEEEKNVNLIVMGMRGVNSRLDEIFIGSITTTTLRKSKTPVLIIPEKAKYKIPKKIVFAYDYESESYVYSIDTIKELTEAFGPKILIVNIKQAKESISAKRVIKTKQDKQKNIEHIYLFSGKDDVADTINEYIEGHNTDMVAIIPHQYSLIEGLFHKSVSKKLAFHTHIPLLAIPDNHKTIPAYFL
jgi:nucleotide-binding universal stress UspA family protein